MTDRFAEGRRHGVSNLPTQAVERVIGWEHEGVRERLKACGLSRCDWAIGDGMQKASLLWSEELGADRRCGFVPLETPEHVIVSRRLAPTGQNQVRRQLAPGTALADRSEALEVYVTHVPPIVAVTPVGLDG